MGWLSDVGNAVSSAASAVGDAVEDVVDAVVDTVEDAVDAVVDTVQDGIEAVTEWTCKNGGSFLCGVANVIGGTIDGLLEGFQDIVHDVADIVRDVGGIIGSILRLDLPGLLKQLGELGLDILDLVVDVGRFITGGYIVGGIVKHFKRSMLMHFVEDLLNQRFANDPQTLATIRENIGLDGGTFGFRLPAEHRVFAMDSQTVPLWQMHQAGTIDLFAMAGLLSFDSFAIGAAHPNTLVKSVGSNGQDNWWSINRWTIAKYLESNGTDGRLRVYAMDDQTISRNLSTASRKLEELAVRLQWNDGDNFSWFRGYTRQDITQAEYNFNSGQIEALLGQPEYNRPAGINCNLVALGAFKLDIFGRVGGRNISECTNFPANCATPGRSDLCCNTIDRSVSSGVIYRDVYPSDIFQYVLPHEIGHYMGLCHCGHDGFQNIMFRKGVTSFFDWGLFSYYWSSEPHFTLEDGRNTWRFIVDQMLACLTGASEVVGAGVLVQPLVLSKDSCAVEREPQKDESHVVK